MGTLQLFFLAIVFIVVFLTAMIVLIELSPSALLGRLAASAATVAPPAAMRKPSPWSIRIASLAEPFGRLSVPAEGWEGSRLRIRFMNAGYRRAGAPVAFFAAKSLLTFLLPALLLFARSLNAPMPSPPLFLASLIVVAGAGYMLPNLLLARRIAVRQREIFESFPDALDLMTICVEAGLGLDAAIARVAREIGMKSTVLAQELHLVGLELRAGSSRNRALRNLALRTGVEEIDTLVAMLVQADRFGTSVADSLRVHADSLRSKRRQRAEEVAAKVPTKLLFPLIFCVFPSMMLVLLGPAFINIYRTLLPTLTGH